MGTYEELKQAISAVIRENNNQEITGAILQNTLLSIINTVGSGATFAGIANTRTTPSRADANVFYIATEPGTYPNFGGITIRDEVAILKNGSGRWEVETFGAATKSSVDVLSTTISNEITRAKNAESTLSQSINTEKQNITRNTNSIIDIKNTIVKSNVSNNEELNDIIKELYISHYPKSDYTLKSVSIYRNHTSHGYNIIFLSTDKAGNNVWTNCNFSSKAESEDVSYGTISNQDGVGWCFGAELYALIDWSKINNGGEKVFSINDFSFNNHIYNVKFSPQINSCITNHKFSHSAEANNIVKELYFSDVKKNGSNVSDYDFKRFFSFERIDRKMQNKDGKDFWSIVFYVNNTDTGYHNHLFITYMSSPEDDDVLKMELRTTVGDDLYSATVYIVLDWTAISQNSSYSLNARLITGARVKVNYPIIYNYIENEALRTQLAELTAQKANMEE